MSNTTDKDFLALESAFTAISNLITTKETLEKMSSQTLVPKTTREALSLECFTLNDIVGKESVTISVENFTEDMSVEVALEGIRDALESGIRWFVNALNTTSDGLSRNFKNFHDKIEKLDKRLDVLRQTLSHAAEVTDGELKFREWMRPLVVGGQFDPSNIDEQIDRLVKYYTGALNGFESGYAAIKNTAKEDKNREYIVQSARTLFEVVKGDLLKSGKTRQKNKKGDTVDATKELSNGKFVIERVTGDKRSSAFDLVGTGFRRNSIHFGFDLLDTSGGLGSAQSFGTQTFARLPTSSVKKIVNQQVKALVFCEKAFKEIDALVQRENLVKLLPNIAYTIQQASNVGASFAFGPVVGLATAAVAASGLGARIVDGVTRGTEGKWEMHILIIYMRWIKDITTALEGTLLEVTEAAVRYCEESVSG